MKSEINNEFTEEEQIRKDRRAFLSKSKYAVYMTPVMLSMVVDKDASAASSPGCVNGQGNKTCP